MSRIVGSILLWVLDAVCGSEPISHITCTLIQFPRNVLHVDSASWLLSSFLACAVATSDCQSSLHHSHSQGSPALSSALPPGPLWRCENGSKTCLVWGCQNGSKTCAVWTCENGSKTRALGGLVGKGVGWNKNLGVPKSCRQKMTAAELSRILQ